MFYAFVISRPVKLKLDSELEDIPRSQAMWSPIHLLRIAISIA